jgi:predicted nucleotidyltransferase
MTDEDVLDRLRRPLAALTHWFHESGVRAAIIGGVAASLRGKARLTNDIDAVVLDQSAEDLLEGGRRFGFVARIADAVEFAHNTRVLLLRFETTNVPIDLSLGALPFEEEIIERSTLINVGGTKVRVASPEDLIIMKAIAGRPRDVMDIENILRANTGLDLDRVRHWVREFSAVLEMPEIHENLENLLKSSPTAGS